ncbi:MAG: sigma-70 family RNA polymerase sigma factor [Anaerolineae bacterium]|nr:sigma-70 family RNA polymerase sigma factor [Anaerolineae bacterium]
MKVEALYSALTRLKQDQREVLALRFGAELSIKVTASIMNKSVNAVKVLQYRALSALKDILEPWK